MKRYATLLCTAALACAGLAQPATADITPMPIGAVVVTCNFTISVEPQAIPNPAIFVKGADGGTMNFIPYANDPVPGVNLNIPDISCSEAVDQAVNYVNQVAAQKNPPCTPIINNGANLNTLCPLPQPAAPVAPLAPGPLPTSPVF